jgi:hypothetical protein
MVCSWIGAERRHRHYWSQLRSTGGSNRRIALSSMANDRRGHLEIGAAPRLARRTRVPEEGAFAPPLGFAQLTTSLRR